MSDLILIEAEKHLSLYRDMCHAIGDCHRVDECKDIADKSVALAAYYKQIKDDKTVQMFNEVRLRAWRRIGKLFGAVDISKCETWSAKIATIRAEFDDAAMISISDSRIREILDLSAVTDDEFEIALESELSGSIPDLIRHTPSWQAEARKAQEEIQARVSRPPTAEEIAQRREQEKEQAAIAEAAALFERHTRELEAASEQAMKEVGITLERKDRARMKSVVFLIKGEVHSVMRQAAFDQKVTMQEILRRGLKMWLVAHDYDFPAEDER